MMAVQEILVPYNFTAYERKSLDFIIHAFSHQKDVKISLFNSYTPLPEIDIKETPELRKMHAGLAFLSGELKKKEKGLISAKEYLLENNFSDDQVDYIFKERKKDIADEIIDMLLSGHYKIVVLTPRLAKKRLLTRSVHDKLLRTVKDITICLAT
jgi:HSP90 family molecular chaperone